MLDFITFNAELEKIDTQTKVLSIGEKQPIFDGPVDIEEYYYSKIKILWILKEPYDHKGKGKGGFHYRDHIGQENVYVNFLNQTKSQKTWYPIIYASYGILNNFTVYDEIDFIEKDPKVAEVLYNVAVININKLAGNSTSIHSEISRIFKQTKNILKQQIDLLSPDIIIGGNTLHHFSEILGLQHLTKGISKKNETTFYHDSNRLYIDAYHPGYRVKRENNVNEEYVNDIITIAKDFYSKK